MQIVRVCPVFGADNSKYNRPSNKVYAPPKESHKKEVFVASFGVLALAFGFMRGGHRGF